MTQPHCSRCAGSAGLSLALAIVLSLIAGTVHAQAATPPPTGKAMDLPMVWLEAKGSFSRDTPAPFTARLALPGQSQPEAATWKGQVRWRGSSSLGFPKKSYALFLDAPASPLGLPAHRHWILNASFIDRSLMRHKLAYDLFRSLSEPSRPRYAASSRFVELQFNGAYQGVYLLMERVDQELAGLPPYLKEDKAHTAIYKAINHDGGFVQTGHGGFEQIVPEATVFSYWQPLDALNQFIQTASPADFFNPQTGIAAQLDLDNTIDFHLLVLVTGNADGITKNFFLVRPKPLPGQTARFFFVPWDFDGSMGQNWNATPLPPELWLTNQLFDRLLQDSSYRQRLAARWAQLRGKQFSTPSIHAMIDANVKEMAAAAARNSTRWAANANLYPDPMTFEQNIAQMKAWTTAHLAWLDGAIQARASKK